MAEQLLVKLGIDSRSALTVVRAAVHSVIATLSPATVSDVPFIETTCVLSAGMTVYTIRGITIAVSVHAGPENTIVVQFASGTLAAFFRAFRLDELFRPDHVPESVSGECDPARLRLHGIVELVTYQVDVRTTNDMPLDWDQDKSSVVFRS